MTELVAATRIVKGTCQLDCPDACGFLVEVDEDGRAVALRGNPDHPFTAGALCGKVNRSLDGIYGDDRLLYPLRRVGAKGEGRFERTSWDDAIELTAAGLQRAIDAHGPESVLGLYFGGTMGHVQGWSFGPRFFAHLGGSRLDPNMCDGAAVAACEYTLGGSVGYDPEDVVHSKLIVLWGINTLTANVHHWKFVREAQRRGAYTVAIDPIRTTTADHCDEHIAPLPGTDGALALGLMRVLLDEGAEDRDWLEAHTVGWPELKRRLAEWPVERAAAECGLEPGTVRELGLRIARTRPTALRVGLGLQRTGGGGAAIRAIMALPALTGDWRHVGGGALNQTLGHFPYGLDHVIEPPDMPAPPARTVNISRLGEAFTELDDPPVAATVIFNFNPAASNPDQNKVRAGLARDDMFVAVLEQRLTDTTDYADVVLPITSNIEHFELVNSYGHNYLGWNEPAIKPPGECITNNEVFRRLARAMGLTHPRLFDSDLEIAAQLIDNDLCRSRGITVETMREKGFVRASGFETGVAPFAEGGFPTPSGKVELWSQALEDEGSDPLVGYVPPTEVSDTELAQRLPLVLITPATRFFLNSTFASLEWHRNKVGPIHVYVHPDDAAERRLSEGSRVRVFNDRGAFIAETVITDAARRGVVMAPKTHWLKLVEGGSNPNATTPERDADMAGAPTFHDNRVEIVALDRPGGADRTAATSQFNGATAGPRDKPTILVIQHIACEPPAAFEEELDAREIPLVRVEVDEGEPLPDWRAFDAIVAMGGPMSVNDEAGFPWLSEEKRVIADAVRAGLPYWGVCLGAQLLAASLGARVYTGEAPEVGLLRDLARTRDARFDPVFADFPESLPALQWHSDTFELPRGATLLARSPAYENQAFVWRRAYGLQFHLEVTPELGREWGDVPAYAASLAEILGEGALPRLVEEIAANADETTRFARALFGRWLDHVVEPARAGRLARERLPA